jgi:hypothetical protein
MSSPSPADVVLVRPEAVTSLAGELTALAAELYDDVDHCRVAAGSLSTALDGDDGWTAGAAATAWSTLEDVLAERTVALAQTATAAVQTYLDQDARIAGDIRPGEPRMPR